MPLSAIARSVIILAAVVPLTLVAACGPATPTGYWEGKGKAKEVPMKDDFRTLTRTADYEFWFVLDKDGTATGEIELVYDAELKVENLPQFTLPMPSATISFAPKVGGKVTDLNPRRKFPLVGVLDVSQLILAIATPELDRPTIEFTIRADPGVSAGFGKGARAGGGSASKVIKIPMTPFSPFGGGAKVEKRPGGPYAATYGETGSNYSFNWSARQLGGEQREAPRISPEMQQQIDELRRLLRR